MSDLRGLLERLRHGDQPVLTAADIEALLGWLNGSASRDGNRSLPRPEHEPALLRTVFYHLDVALFEGGELLLEAAAVDPSEPVTRRRIRFRRLSSAFHPDRYPDLSDWLTERSQAIHHAYSEFKDNPAEPAPQPRFVQPESAADCTYPEVGRVRQWAERLRARFGGDRFLAHKLVGALAFVALLPVINLMLVPEPDPAADSIALDGEADELSGLAVAPARDQASDTVTIAAGTAQQAAAGETPSPEDVPARAGEQPLATPSDSALRGAARRAIDPNADRRTGGSLTSVDEQLAAMGLQTDAARLHERLRSGDGPAAEAGQSREPDATARRAEPDENAPAPSAPGVGEPQPNKPMRRLQPGGAVPSIQSVIVRSEAGEEAGAEPNHDRVVGTAANALGNGQAGSRARPGPPERGGSKGGPSAEPATASEPSSQRRGRAGGPDEAEETAAAESEQTRTDSARSGLGPLASHPVGDLIEALRRKLSAGQVPGVTALFAIDGRVADASGHARIADYFSDWIEDHDTSNLDIRVMRLQREGEGWRVEAEFSIHDAAYEPGLAPHGRRTELLLVERGGRMVIQAMDP